MCPKPMWITPKEAKELTPKTTWPPHQGQMNINYIDARAYPTSVSYGCQCGQVIHMYGRGDRLLNVFLQTTFFMLPHVDNSIL